MIQRTRQTARTLVLPMGGCREDLQLLVLWVKARQATWVLVMVTVGEVLEGEAAQEEDDHRALRIC